MNDLPSVTEIVAEVQERFGDRLDAVRVPGATKFISTPKWTWSPASPPIFTKTGMRGW
jgi:hypothetical protein